MRFQHVYCEPQYFQKNIFSSIFTSDSHLDHRVSSRSIHGLDKKKKKIPFCVLKFHPKSFDSGYITYSCSTTFYHVFAKTKIRVGPKTRTCCPLIDKTFIEQASDQPPVVDNPYEFRADDRQNYVIGSGTILFFYFSVFFFRGQTIIPNPLHTCIF